MRTARRSTPIGYLGASHLVELSGLPPVRLHDLRHLAATLSLLAGHDIKVVQEKLGHSSRQR
ncbi:tyrosine-type recombinase/integrase [Streptomyces murinus]|uniref:Integrase n=1 Tax=Streptomyces murinus TaxID=33900 RepID=A0A7W3RKZ3_STRMR|nr:tyrosine-type recombinase/integrase [Streptomyces murinus]MBA9053475.1 integrase [Streptomyces murinus]